MLFLFPSLSLFPFHFSFLLSQTAHFQLFMHSSLSLSLDSRKKSPGRFEDLQASPCLSFRTLVINMKPAAVAMEDFVA